MDEFYSEIERIAKFLHKAAIDAKQEYQENEGNDHTKGMLIGNAYAFNMAAEMLKEAAIEHNKRIMSQA